MIIYIYVYTCIHVCIEIERNPGTSWFLAEVPAQPWPWREQEQHRMCSLWAVWALPMRCLNDLNSICFNWGGCRSWQSWLFEFLNWCLIYLSILPSWGDLQPHSSDQRLSHWHVDGIDCPISRLDLLCLVWGSEKPTKRCRVASWYLLSSCPELQKGQSQVIYSISNFNMLEWSWEMFTINYRFYI